MPPGLVDAILMRDGSVFVLYAIARPLIKKSSIVNLSELIKLVEGMIAVGKFTFIRAFENLCLDVTKVFQVV